MAPDEQPGVPACADFARLVRDAQRRLHDPIALQTHPLTRLLPEPNNTRAIAGQRLHQLLVNAIGALRPRSGVDDAKARRGYDLLTLRYVEALEISEVSARLAISRREYSREHRQALDAVIALLAETAAYSLTPPAHPATSKTRTDVPSASGVPQPLSSFIGRAQEIADVLRLIETVRLVTLSGPPGSGKTRLALQIARVLASASDSCGPTIRDRVTFVPLASIPDPELVVSAIVRSLGVREVPNRSQIALLAAEFSRRRTLLILDNFEHVLEATPQVSHLLASCPQLTVLVTSRASLRLSGEHEFVVPPLGVPERNGVVAQEQIVRSEAVRLYVDRARAAQSAFRLTEQNAAAVAEICRRLDGLPLAIELAAARSKIFPPYALLGRLSREGDADRAGPSLQLLTGGQRDMPTRQQTLHSAIDWSYRLLPEDEQQLLAQLSVFAGGWQLEAAEAVCTTQSELDVLERVSSLIDKSLVQQEEMTEGEPRFGMLETIRAFAREQLDARGEESQAVRRRHAAYVLAIAQQADANFWGRERSRWLGRLNQEVDNLRAALAWATDTGAVDLALQLGGRLFWFWHDGGHWVEARRWLQRALALASPDHRTEDRAAALSAAGVCNWCLGDFTTAQTQSEEGLAISRALGDRQGMGHALHGLGVLAADRGDVASARVLIAEGLAHSQASEDRPFVGLALHQLGRIAMHEHDEDMARSWIEQSRHVWQELGCPEALALAATSLGDLARTSGHYAAAAGYYQESLALIGEGGPLG